MASRSIDTSTPFRLLLFSASSPQGIEGLANRLRRELERDPAAYSGSATHLFREGDGSGGWRAAVLFQGAADGCAALAPNSGRLLTAQLPAGRARSAVLMFPGLGEQYVNMGLGLYRSEPVFRASVDRSAEILRDLLGLDVRDVLYPEPARAAEATTPEAPPRKLDLRRMLGRGEPPVDAAAQRLNRTELVQPVLFVIELALAELLRSWGLRIEAMIGYSLGEYATACLSGVLSVEDSLALVARRAQLIEHLPPGEMLAVTLQESEVLPLLSPELSLSAVNGRDYCVIGGPKEAVAALERQLDERGVATRRVKTTHAFHSRMMEPISGRVTELCAGYSFHPPRVPYISNVTGAPITAEQATSASYLATHLCSPVRCADGFRSLHASSGRIFVEAGPGQSMCSLAVLQQTEPAPGDPSQRRPVAIPMMRTSYESRDDREALLAGLGQLWLAGAELDWERFPCHSADAQASSAAGRAAPDEASCPAAPPSPSGSASADPAIVEQIARLWSDLFRGAKITASSSFRELGGNSLLATRLAQRLRKTFGIPIPLTRIFSTNTVADQALLIAGMLRPAEKPAGAAPIPKAAEPSLPSQITLPNGMTIFHQNEAETQHFYRDIFEHRSYLKGGLVIPERGTVFDVGANIGMFTMFAAREARGVKVYSFEPAPPLFEILKRNVERHRADARIFNHGLSSSESTAPFTFYPRSSGMSSFYADLGEEKQVLRAIIANQQKAAMPGMDLLAPHTEELLDVRFEARTFHCPLRRMSDVIREQGCTTIDLLKVDVQKAEMEVLAGISDSDWPRIRQIAIEVHDIGGRLAQMVSLLEGRGYAVRYEQDELYQGTNLYNIHAGRK